MDQEQVRLAAEARGYRREQMADGNWRLIGADGRVAVADWTMDRGLDDDLGGCLGVAGRTGAARWGAARVNRALPGARRVRVPGGGNDR